MKIILLITLLLTFSIIEEANARDYVDSMCYAAMWNSGARANVRKIFPIKKVLGSGFYSSVEYYSYGKPYGASSNTPDGLEQSSVAQYYFFDDDEEVSLFFYFDIFRDDSGGVVAANITSEGLAGRGAFVTVRDDPGDSSYAWNDVDGTSSPFWRWWPCCTDGMVLGNLPQPVEKGIGSFNPTDHSFCVNIAFSADPELFNGVTQFKVQTLREYFEDGPRIIENFPIPANQANSLRLCYTQCNCILGAELTEDRAKFDNKAVVEGYGSGSGIGRYAADSSCSWVIKPDINPDYVAVYFDEFEFDSINDQVTFYQGLTDETVQIANYPTANTAAALDWTASIEGEIDLTTFLSTYNTFLIPRSTSGTFEALVTFTSDEDSNGGLGFVVTYVSVAVTESVTPDTVSLQGEEEMVITGKYFLDVEHLSCAFTASDSLTPVIRPATWISETSVKCIVPPRPGTSNSGNVSISNDRMQFFNSVEFSYIDRNCEELPNCAACSANPECAWCAHLEDVEQSKCASLENSGDPEIVNEGECPTDTFTWHPSCCDTCTVLDSCNENGVCECDSTCTCNMGDDIAYTGPTCNCECPVHEGEICNGHGKCNCDGTCTCEYPYRGDKCECLDCRGSGGETREEIEAGFCFGNGDCTCAGTCSCDDGFDSEFECLCPLECPKVNGEQCAGNGDCVCGQCQCNIGWTGDLCDCSDPEFCPTQVPGQECSGHGTCNCDRECECDDGWEGDRCDKTDKCYQTTCETCQDDYKENEDAEAITQEFCVWCPKNNKCVHESKSTPCYDAVDEDGNEIIYTSVSEDDEETDDKIPLNPENCPISETPPDDLREPDNTVAVASIAAAVIGLVIALVIAALLGLLGKSQTDGLASFDFMAGPSEMMTKNPLHTSAGTTQSSGIYQA